MTDDTVPERVVAVADVASSRVRGRRLDSLSLVSVIVDVETAVADELGKAVSLTDDKAMTQDISPFSDVATLARYVIAQLDAA